MSDHRVSNKAIAIDNSISQLPQQWDRPQVQGITIDGPTSLDLDDAIWIEPTDTGARLSVHISDVAEFIPAGSALDHDAIAKVHTRYHTVGNSPMLPRHLSEAALSLQEGQPRATVTIQLELGPDGQTQFSQIFESWLISSQRFDYAQADDGISDATSKWHSLLQACQDWAQRLNQHRRAQGAMGGMVTTGGFYLDESGRLSTASHTQYHSHQIISEFMIAANTAAARWLAESDCLALYRNHTAKTIAPEQDAMLQALLVLGSAPAIRERLQNWLHRAEYSPALIGHFALNLPAYGHFTSPIRRLPDLINHRIIKARLKGTEQPYTKLDLENLSGHINQTILDEGERTRTYYRTKAKETLQTQLESEESFAQLSVKDFSKLLKHADGEFPPALLQEVRSRLTKGQLQVLDSYRLLTGKDEALRQLVLEHLGTHEAASILSMAINQQETWDSFHYHEQHGTQFLAWAEVTIEGAIQTTVEPGSATKKQTARHQACWLWLDAFVKKKLVAPSQRLQVEDTVPQDPQVLTKPQMDGHNYVGELLELCQGRKWEPPIFAFEIHEAGFTCICRLSGQEREGVAIASQKKLAKQQAAKDMLTLIATNLANESL